MNPIKLGMKPSFSVAYFSDRAVLVSVSRDNTEIRELLNEGHRADWNSSHQGWVVALGRDGETYDKMRKLFRERGLCDLPKSPKKLPEKNTDLKETKMILLRDGWTYERREDIKRAGGLWINPLGGWLLTKDAYDVIEKKVKEESSSEENSAEESETNRQL